MTYTVANSRKSLRYPSPPVRIRRRHDIVTSDPPQPLYTFRGANAVAQTMTAPAWILSGPFETGKTVAVAHLLDMLARQYPRAQGAIVRKVRTDMDGTVLVTWRRIIEQRGDVRVFGGERPQWYDYPNGTRIYIGGLDRPEKTLSGERDWIYVNQIEELSEEDFEMLTRSVTGRGAVTPHPMIFGDCNPGPEDHWILQRAQAGSLTLLHSRHEDNPTLYDDAGALTEQGRRTMAVLHAMTGVRFQRGVLGLWVGAEGMYYTQLDEQRHIVDMPRVPEGWPVWGALDYGWAHPLSFGVFTADPRGRIYLVGRHSAMKWNIPTHAAAMDALLDQLGVDKRVLRIAAGHDCWATGHDDPETIADKFKKHGYRLHRAVISRVIGARNIGERLGNPESNPPIPPTFFIARHCRQVFVALSRMVHDPDNLEDVLKKNADANGRGGDDDYDMVRYGLMERPLAPARAARSQSMRTLL